MMWHPHKHRSDHEILLEIEEKVGQMAVTVEELTTAFNTLKSDLEAKAAEAKAEFEKLESELTAAGSPAELAPLKASIETLDTAVKAAVVPTA